MSQVDMNCYTFKPVIVGVRIDPKTQDFSLFAEKAALSALGLKFRVFETLPMEKPRFFLTAPSNALRLDSIIPPLDKKTDNEAICPEVDGISGSRSDDVRVYETIKLFPIDFSSRTFMI